MTPEHLFELILALIGAVVALELLARRAHLPPAAAFILGGIVLALIPATPEVVLNPDLVMVLFLPPLLMASAYNTVWRDFRANLRIIGQLAVGAVAFTTAVVGVAAHWLEPALPWAACFALGAIVSPPDAVAAKAVLAGVRLPRRMVVLLEGESLVNDATGLVLFRFAVLAAVTGGFSAGAAAVSFGVLAVGGVLLGLAFGWAAMQVIKRLADPSLAIISGLLTSWISYIAADAAGVSGVLSTVTCGLVVGWQQHRLLSARVRMDAGAIWEVLTFILESMVFILIGLSLRGVLTRLGSDPHGIAPLILPACVIILAVILSRFAWMFPATYLPRLLFPRLRARDPVLPVSIPVIMSWAGMRGVVSLAAALALPENFPGRDFIVATTFAVILVTVLVQGSTLGPLIRVLRLTGLTLSGRKTLTITEARVRMVQAQLAVVEHVSAAADGSQRHPRLVEQYGYRLQAVTRFHEADGGLIGVKSQHFDVVLAAIAAGRSELLRLHQSGDMHESVLNELEQELDLEEVTARRYRG